MEGNINKRKELLNFYKKQVDDMIKSNQVNDIFPFLQGNVSIIKYDNDLMAVWYLGMIVEKEMNVGIKSVFEKENSLEALLERYHRLKFFLRRIENDILEDRNEFYIFLSEHEVSEYELMGMVDSSIYHKDKVWVFLQS